MVARVCTSQNKFILQGRIFSSDCTNGCAFWRRNERFCSTVASSPILAVQLVKRALTTYNNCKNHLLTLYADVIGGASAGAARHYACVSQFLQIA